MKFVVLLIQPCWPSESTQPQADSHSCFCIVCKRAKVCRATGRSCSVSSRGRSTLRPFPTLVSEPPRSRVTGPSYRKPWWEENTRIMCRWSDLPFCSLFAQITVHANSQLMELKVNVFVFIYFSQHCRYFSFWKCGLCSFWYKYNHCTVIECVVHTRTIMHRVLNRSTYQKLRMIWRKRSVNTKQCKVMLKRKHNN